MTYLESFNQNKKNRKGNFINFFLKNILTIFALILAINVVLQLTNITCIKEPQQQQEISCSKKYIYIHTYYNETKNQFIYN